MQTISRTVKVSSKTKPSLMQQRLDDMLSRHVHLGLETDSESTGS